MVNLAYDLHQSHGSKLRLRVAREVLVTSMNGGRRRVFLSYSRPCWPNQTQFLTGIQEFLHSHGYDAVTVQGVSTDPLPVIRSAITTCAALLTIAFRRRRVEYSAGTDRNPDLEVINCHEERWVTSAYCQIEMAMAYYAGLPILALRERGVVCEGMLTQGADFCVPEFDPDESALSYLTRYPPRIAIGEWENGISASESRVDLCGRCNLSGVAATSGTSHDGLSSSVRTNC